MVEILIPVLVGVSVLGFFFLCCWIYCACAWEANHKKLWNAEARATNFREQELIAREEARGFRQQILDLKKEVTTKNKDLADLRRKLELVQQQNDVNSEEVNQALVLAQQLVKCLDTRNLVVGAQ
jgi:uncharacterized membrane protein